MINGVVLTSSSLLMRGLGLIFNIYVSNQVGSEAIGVFSLVMSVYLFAITFANSGIGLACTCLVSEEFAKSNYEDGFKAVRTCLFFSVLLGFLSLLLIFITAPIISKTWLNGMISPKPLYIIGFGLPLIAVSSVINGYFCAIGKSFKNAISQVVELSAKMIITIFLLKLFHSSDIEVICSVLLLGDVISEVFSFTLNLILYFNSRNMYRSVCYRQKNFSMKRRIFNIAFPVAITSYIRSGLSSLKQFLIPSRLVLSGLSYSMAVSSYGLIQGIVMPILMFASVLLSSFSNLLIPEFSRLLAGGNPKRMKTVCEKIFQITFVFSIGIGYIFFFFSNEISLLVYQNIECGKWIKFLAPLVLFIYVDMVFDSILKGVNEQFGVMCCNILDLVLTIGFIYFLVPILGIEGYVFSICFSEILNFTISNIQLKRKIDYKIDWKMCVIFPLIIGFIGYGIITLVSSLFKDMTFAISSCIKIALFVFFYLLVYFVYYIFSNKKLTF